MVPALTRWSAIHWVAVVLVTLGCVRTTPVPATPGSAVQETSLERRLFAPTIDGERVLAGISYGPFREGQKPGGPYPSVEQITEDLRIIAPRWGMIRVYSSREPTEDILRAVRDNQLPIHVMVGAWLAPTSDAENLAEVEGAIRLANAYPDVVAAVSIGNESQVYWSGHRVPTEKLIEYLRMARAAIRQPVTTADDYNFWNKPESYAVSAVVDFLTVHAYAMWNQQSLESAVPWTATVYQSIRDAHPEIPVVCGETGWATELDPNGDEVKYIKAPAGEAEQRVFYEAFTRWAAEAEVPYFYFEAFDEPWKGSESPREVEKHWGLYGVDRQPKAALRSEQSARSLDPFVTRPAPSPQVRP
jgi:exo-beta-1,3-glucanase (GH17 family)